LAKKRQSIVAAKKISQTLKVLLWAQIQLLGGWLPSEFLAALHLAHHALLGFDASA
jgi:hypothetical protein